MENRDRIMMMGQSNRIQTYQENLLIIKLYYRELYAK